MSPVPNPHWKTQRLKYNSYIKGRVGWQNLRSDEFTLEGPYLVTGMHFKEDRVDWETCYHVSPERYAMAPEIQLRDDDLLITKDGTIGKLAHVRHLPGPACLNSHLLVIRPLRKAYAARFLFYLLSSSAFHEFILQRQSGTTFFGLTQDAIENFPATLPPLDEQRAIADFLDDKMAKIDELIAKKLTLISSINEQRMTVVSDAVTKGLNPRAPMKNSGMDWLGEIPAHWQIISVRRVLDRVEQGWSPDCSSYPAGPDEWGVVKAGCANYGRFAEEENKALPDYLQPLPEYEIRAGDILMSRASGSPELVGSTALVRATRPKLLLSDKIFRLHVASKVSKAYFVAVFNSRFARAQIERAISGADGLARNLPQSAMKNFLFALPPIDEQESIVSYLENALTTIEALTQGALNALNLLREYRSAFISAAVTGQIDVRNYRPQEAAALCQ